MDGEQPSCSEAELKVRELKIKLFDLLEEKDKANRREEDLRAELATKETQNRTEVDSLSAKLEELDQRARMWEAESTKLRKDLADKEEEKHAGVREWTTTRLEFQTAKKTLEEEIRILRKKLEEKEEELRTRSEEATEREETLKKDVSGAKEKLAFYLRSLEETTERWANLKKERDGLIKDRQQTAKLLGELAQLIKMDFSEEDLKDLNSFLQRVVDQTKEVMESLGRQLAEGRGFLESFGNLYQSACVSMGLDPTSSAGSCAKVSPPSNLNIDPDPIPDSEMMALDLDDRPPPQQPAFPSGSTSISGRATPPAPRARRQGRPPANWRRCSENRQRTNFVLPRGDHGPVIDPCGTGTAVPLFWCKCGLEYNDKGGLDMHVRKMTNEWCFRCRPCNWYFFHASSLRRHQQSQCCIRKRMEAGRLATLKRLRNVRASKPQQRPMRSRRQPQRFVNDANPIQEPSDSWSSSEEDEASGESLPFRCERCDERFERVLNLKRHLEKCHGEIEPLKGIMGCSACGGLFPGWEALRAHKRSAHRRSGTSDPIGDQLVELEEDPEESRVVADMPDLNAAVEPVGTRMEGVEESVLGAREGSEDDAQSPPNLSPEN